MDVVIEDPEWQWILPKIRNSVEMFTGTTETSQSSQNYQEKTDLAEFRL